MYFDYIRFDYAHIVPASPFGPGARRGETAFGNAMLSVNKDGHLVQDVRPVWISGGI